MSPRSEEFMEQARERLADAQKIAGMVHPAGFLEGAGEFVTAIEGLLETD